MTVRLFLLDILPQTILQEVSKSSILFNGIQSNACAQSPCKTTALVKPYRAIHSAAHPSSDIGIFPHHSMPWSLYPRSVTAHVSIFGTSPAMPCFPRAPLFKIKFKSFLHNLWNRVSYLTY